MNMAKRLFSYSLPYWRTLVLAFAADRTYSLPYKRYEDTSFWRRRLYRFMEFSGISTF